jgi:hypothetical protein
MSEQSDAAPQAENADALDVAEDQQNVMDSKPEGDGSGPGSESDASGPAGKEQSADGEGKPDPKLAKMAFENRELKRRLQQIEQERTQSTIQSLQSELDNPRTLDDFKGDQAGYAKYLIDLGRKATQLDGLQQQQQAEGNVAGDQPPPVDYAQVEESYAIQHDDFYEVAYDPTLPVSQTMAQAIRSAENGPEVLYALGKDPERAARIAKLPDIAQAGAIKTLAATLAKGKQRPPKAEESSNAPPPPEELAPSAGAETGLSAIKPSDPKSDQLSDEEWIRRRNKELAKRRQR